MVSNIYYGVIKASKLQTWETNHDPYEILEENIEINVSGWDFLFQADKIFRAKMQADWGSYAYKANLKELKRMEIVLKCKIPRIDDLRDDMDYGIVFIEGV